MSDLSNRSPLIIPSGYEVADELSSYDDITLVNAGAGYLGTPVQVLTSRVVPPSARLLIVSMFLRVVDQTGYDQIRFMLRWNGIERYPYNAIPGERVTIDPIIPVNMSLYPGTVDIAAQNLAGQGLPGSSLDSLNIRCAASWYGFLLRQSGK